MKVAALICAKGQSTRCHNKNTRICGGKRLIDWALEIANGANCIDDVYVSTDSNEIQTAAWQHGATVINRPVQLVQPLASGGAVWVHALKQMAKFGIHYDYAINIWCTSPLVQSWQIDDAFNEFIAAGWPTQLASATRVKASAISHCMIIDPARKQLISPFGLQGVSSVNNLLQWVWTNGAFGIYNPNLVDLCKIPEITSDMTLNEVEAMYLKYATAWTAQTFPIMQESVYGYVIDDISAFDINTEDDLALADYYFKRREEQKYAK